MPTNIVRFQILTIVVGLCIDKITSMVLHDTTLFKVLCVIYFFITLLNFYHGKIAATEDAAYRETGVGLPVLSVIDFYLNSLLIVSFLFIAYLIDNFMQFLISNMVMRALDLALVGHGLWVASARRDKLPTHFSAYLYWGIFNGFTIFVIIIYLMLLEQYKFDGNIWMPALLIFMSLLDIVLDYAVNRIFYFGRGAGQ